MPWLDPVSLICIVGCVLFGVLYRFASDRVWYRDEEGDGVSARSVCGYLSLICLVVLVAKAIRWLRG